MLIMRGNGVRGADHGSDNAATEPPHGKDGSDDPKMDEKEVAKKDLPARLPQRVASGEKGGVLARLAKSRSLSRSRKKLEESSKLQAAEAASPAFPRTVLTATEPSTELSFPYSNPKSGKGHESNNPAKTYVEDKCCREESRELEKYIKSGRKSGEHEKPDKLPISTDTVIVNTPKRNVMRNISKLGMEDPVMFRMSDLVSLSSAAASEQLSQRFDSLDLANNKGCPSPTQSPGWRSRLRRVPSSISVDCDDIPDSSTVISDHTATSTNGLDRQMFHQVLNPIPSIQESDLRNANKPERLKSPGHPKSSRMVTKIHCASLEDIKAGGGVQQLTIEDLQAAVDRHNHQQKQQHQQERSSSHAVADSPLKRTVAAWEARSSKEHPPASRRRSIGGFGEGSFSPTTPSFASLSSSLHAHRGSSFAPPKTPKRDALSSSLHSHRNSHAVPKTPRTPKSDLLSSSLHSSGTSCVSPLTRLPNDRWQTQNSHRLDPFQSPGGLDSVSNHSQSTVEASTSTVEVCNSSSRRRRLPTSKTRTDNLLDNCGPKQLSLPSALGAFPPLLFPTDEPDPFALPQYQRMPRRGSLPAEGSGNRVVVKVRVKKRASMQGGAGSSIYVPSPSSSDKETAGRVFATGPASAAPTWKAPVVPAPVEPSILKSSLKLRAPCGFNDDDHDPDCKPRPPHFLLSETTVAANVTPRPYSLSKSSALANRPDESDFASDDEKVDASDDEKVSADAPLPVTRSPPPSSPSQGVSSTSAQSGRRPRREAAQEMMNCQRVLPNLDSIFAS
jgi:hypothetical protein